MEQTRRLSIAVLIASHNRRPLTTRAVASIRAARTIADLQIILFEDGSSDGTGDAVSVIDPNAIIIRGDGSAFWNRGMHAAWQRACKLNFDAFLWLNDDVLLDCDAIARLVNAYFELALGLGHKRFILAGATRGEDGAITYSGKRHRRRILSFQFEHVTPDESALLPIDAFNGNIVLVTRETMDAIGMIDAHFQHGMGDYEYGLRASHAGIPVRLMPSTLGCCEPNARHKSKQFGGRDLTLLQQWKIVNTPKGLPIRDWYRLTSRYSGRYWLLHFLGPYRWLVLPRWFRRS